MQPAIILFAKAPVPGRVKTRLEPRLGPENTAQLYRAFVRDMLGMLEGLGSSVDLELHTDIPTDAWGDVAVARKLQCAGSLALKMFYALEAALAAGRPTAMIVGSDAPTLPIMHVRELLASTADVTFGPCEDGGYYAIGCRRIHPEMFAGVHWSSPTALTESESAARDCGLRVQRGPVWYDIDEPADLDRLLATPHLPPATAAWFQRFCSC